MPKKRKDSEITEEQRKELLYLRRRARYLEAKNLALRKKLGLLDEKEKKK